MNNQSEKTWTEEEIFVQVKEILKEVAPTKVIGEVTLDSSIVDDFAFDSIDIIDTLLKIQEIFFSEVEEPIDVESFLTQAYQGDDGRVMSVSTICNLIEKYFSLKEENENG